MIEKEDYDTLAARCVNELKVRQSKMQEEYDLDGYDEWFYDQATGLLTFSSEGREINFSYFQAGTFSRNTSTWQWAWANENTLDSVKEKSAAIKDFGSEAGFPKLTDGYFASDEIEAWEFAAIATALTNGLGIYRPVSDHLLLFLVIVEVVDADEAQQLKEKYVDCRIHERARRAFVCHHLNKQTKVGFEEAFETAENMELEIDDDFQAWCDECEKVRENEDGWNDASMVLANIRLVCEHCYFDMKEVNLGYR